MTTALDPVHTARPRTTDVRHPARALLYAGRPGATAILRRRWQIEQHGVHHVPPHGPVVLVANHIGLLDGPLMAIVGPRPVHALTKREMFHGALGQFLVASGQIPVWRERVDPLAVRTALRVLREGGVVGVFPEGTRGGGDLRRPLRNGAAYLAMVTGAPVVPLVFLGTRLAGGTNNSLPPAGSRLVLTYGERIHVPPRPWPRRQQDTTRLTGTIREAMLATLRRAQETTGMGLPGPIPDAPEGEELL